MKRHYFLILFLSTLMFSCKSVHLFSQSDQNGIPCLTRETGVNVKIKNTGNIAFSKFVLKADTNVLIFNGLKPGQESCYKNLPFIWTNNSSEIWFFRTEEIGQKILRVTVDHIGETKIDSGFVTIELKTTGSLKKPKFNLSMNKN